MIGKFAGLMLTLVVNIAAMTVAFYAVLVYMDATATEGQRAVVAGAGDSTRGC